MSADDQRRFLKKFLVGDDCWEWTAGTDGHKYGQFWIGGRFRRSHRVSYEMFVGPVPDGLEIDHLCRNRRCVRPDHLEPVTHRENVMRGDSPTARNAAKTHCRKGHPYSKENTHIPPNGQRVCLIYRRASEKRYRDRLVAAK